MIECILATDMSNHFKVFSTLKSKVVQAQKVNGNGESILKTIISASNNNTIEKFDIQQDIMNYLIHTADISNPSKDFAIYKTWANLCMDEFFHQGDLEKTEHLTIAYLCDRETVNISKAQIGFMNGIVNPLFFLLVEILPELRYFSLNLEKNLLEWKKEVEKEGDNK